MRLSSGCGRARARPVYRVAALQLDDMRRAAQNTLEYGMLIAAIAVIVLLGVSAFGHLVQPWLIALAMRITTSS
jgi:Flp pilus assembly pilin Flp